MLSIGWLVAVVVLAVSLAVALTGWIAFTLTRLERLQGRVDAAGAALDSQLLRRAAALSHLLDTEPSLCRPGDRQLLHTAAEPAPAEGRYGPVRRATENAVGRAVRERSVACAATDSPALAELREAAARVRIARGFYNDAVRDTRSLRDRPLPRALGRVAPMRHAHPGGPLFFDIDDTPPDPPDPPARSAPAFPALSPITAVSMTEEDTV